MNRREALQALVAIPTAAGIEFTEAKIEPDVLPTDLIVLQTDTPIGDETAARIKAQFLEFVRADLKVVVLGGGLTLTVHRGVAKVETT
jgi:hypothetical protein